MVQRKEQRKPWRIREASVEDAAIVHDFIGRLGEHLRSDVTSFASLAELERRMTITQPPSLQAVIAEGKDNPVGICLFYYLFNSHQIGIGVHVEDIIVDEAHRGSGLGRALLGAAASIGRARGATYMRLAVSSTDKDAIDFYERVGFSPVGNAFTPYAADEDVFNSLAENFNSNA